MAKYEDNQDFFNLKSPHGIDYERVWKDDDYRQEITEKHAGKVAANPAGTIELSDSDLEGASGAGTGCSLTAGCCNLPTCFDIRPTVCGMVCTAVLC
jgi:mersacidin/lichenicidin family type 2 lantibiotic